MGKSEPKTEQYLTQIERYESNPIVVSVLAQDTSFEREVEGFYNMATWLIAIPRAGIARKFKFGEEDFQRRGRAPTDLAEILGGFCEEPFDTQKLQYDTVREEKIETTELELRAKISTLIEALDVGTGADIDDLIKSIGYGEKTKELINQLIKDGEIFEVSKGKLRSMA